MVVECPPTFSTDVNGFICNMCVPSLARGPYNAPAHEGTQEAPTTRRRLGLLLIFAGFVAPPADLLTSIAPGVRKLVEAAVRN
jgi:hypothetical protein